MCVFVARPRSRVALSAVVIAAATVALAGCGHGAPPSAAAPPSATTPASATALPSAAAPSQAASGKPFPLACASVDTSGSQASLAPASATAPVTLDEIGTSVGFPVASAMPDTNSAISFQGYESCRYQFTTPAGGAQLDVGLVIGANPLDGKSATAEFAATKATGLPLPDRSGSCDGCGYTFTALPGVGTSAIHGTDLAQDDTVVAVHADVYVEITSIDLKESRLVSLARLVLSKLS
jgi:hypothetical protein